MPLTAVSPPKSEVGALSDQLLLRRMEAGDDALCHRMEIQPRLVVRASCGAARTAALVVAFLLLQRFWRSGLTAGSVK